MLGRTSGSEGLGKRTWFLRFTFVLLSTILKLFFSACRFNQTAGNVGSNQMAKKTFAPFACCICKRPE